MKITKIGCSRYEGDIALCGVTVSWPYHLDIELACGTRNELFAEQLSQAVNQTAVLPFNLTPQSFTGTGVAGDVTDIGTNEYMSDFDQSIAFRAEYLRIRMERLIRFRRNPFRKCDKCWAINYESRVVLRLESRCRHGKKYRLHSFAVREKHFKLIAALFLREVQGSIHLERLQDPLERLAKVAEQTLSVKNWR